MCYHGMGQHKKHKEHNYTDLVCMALSHEVCNVIEDKQRVTPIDPRLTSQREITFVNVTVVYRLYLSLNTCN